jgi:ubiquinone/menaquinone biosynthesis C-methylase UbiE
MNHKIFISIWKNIGKLLPHFVTDWYYQHIKIPYYIKKNLVIRSTNKQEFFQKMNTTKIEEIGEKYWSKQTKWQSQDNISLRRYKKMSKFIKNFFIPYLKKDFVVADLACAAGDITFIIADKVKQIDAFELSADMVDLATKQAKEKNIKNIIFTQANAVNLELHKEIYDAFIMFGLLTCLDDESVEIVVKKVFISMKPKAKLIVRESITHFKSTEYFYSAMTKCLVFHRTEKNYIKLFEDNGFKLIDKTKIESKYHLGLLFEKQ